VRVAGGLLAVCMMVACSGTTSNQPAHPAAQGSTHRSASVSVATHQAFAAFEPGRHDQLLLVDSVTGRVLHMIRALGSVGYAANLRRGLWYLPVAVAAACQMVVDRVTFGGTGPARVGATKLDVLDGGFVDSMSAQPALSADGTELATVLATGPTLKNAGNGPSCGSTDTVAVLDIRTRAVRYLAGRAGDQVDDLAWDHHKLIVRVTPFRPGESVVREVDPTKTLIYSRGRVVLREPHGRPGPVFRFDGCLAVVTEGTIGCIRNGHIRLSHSDHSPSGLPTAVERVTVADDPTNLLLQTPSGETYWWRDNTLHKVPITVKGHWDEPSW
jgi:hypothetical protein